MTRVHLVDLRFLQFSCISVGSGSNTISGSHEKTILQSGDFLGICIMWLIRKCVVFRKSNPTNKPNLQWDVCRSYKTNARLRSDKSTTIKAHSHWLLFDNISWTWSSHLNRKTRKLELHMRVKDARRFVTSVRAVIHIFWQYAMNLFWVTAPLAVNSTNS